MISMKTVKEFFTGVYIVGLTVWYLIALAFGGLFILIKGWGKGEK